MQLFSLRTVAITEITLVLSLVFDCNCSKSSANWRHLPKVTDFDARVNPAKFQSVAIFLVGTKSPPSISLGLRKEFWSLPRYKCDDASDSNLATFNEINLVKSYQNKTFGRNCQNYLWFGRHSVLIKDANQFGLHRPIDGSSFANWAKYFEVSFLFLL